ncbi:MAG TPA: hypothetical protein VNK89_01640 [Thermoflexus sp.]|nr:hypothetical protein [Thermoflexus sp.]
MTLASSYGALGSALAISFLLLLGFLLLLWQAWRGPRGERPGAWFVRGLWLGGVALLGITINLSSLRWAQAERPTGDEETVVTVEAWTWNYRIIPRSIPVERPVVFRVQSLDTIHSFGVYDPRGQLLFTIMAMPGHEEQARFVFHQPGRYTVRCLEYCGVGHGRMYTELLVEGR